MIRKLRPSRKTSYGLDTDAFNLADVGLRKRLQKELGDEADKILAAYRKSRPGASATDLYIAVISANVIGIGATTIAERKNALRAAPVYRYIFVHESQMLLPGTQHKFGAAHALEIPYKFNIVRPASSEHPPDMMSISDPDSVITAHNMSEMWRTFARTGRRGAQGQPSGPLTRQKSARRWRSTRNAKLLSSERSVWEELKP